MKQVRSVALLGGIAAMLESSFATAQVIIFGSNSIPTLNEWGMIALVLLLAVASFYQLRKNGGKAGGLMLLALSAGVAGYTSNSKLINEALAVLPTIVATSNRVDLSGYSGIVAIENGLSTPLTISALVNGDAAPDDCGGPGDLWQIVDPNTVVPAAASNRAVALSNKTVQAPQIYTFCSVGSTIQPGGTCYVGLVCLAEV